MSQTLITDVSITREFLDILHSNMAIVKNMDRQYETKFANSGVALGGKIGPSLQIRKPNQYTVRSGWTMQQQDITEDYATLTIDQPIGIDLNFSDAELNLDISDFKQRYIEPAAKRLAAEADKLAGAYILNNTFNQVGEGTNGLAGTQPSKSSTFLSAIAQVKRNLAPNDGSMNVIIGPDTEAAVVALLADKYNPQGIVSAAYEKGEMAKALGASWWMSQVLSAHTNGTRTDSTPVTAAVPALGATGITVTGGGTLTWAKGDVFTIAGVYAVNPETKQTYSVLKQFVVTADTTSVNTGFTLPVSPAIYVSGAKQNVAGFTSASKALVSVAAGGSGTQSYTYQNDLVMHSKAFAFASCELELPGGLDMAARASADGISLRFLRGYDLVNARYVSRVDLFMGFTALRPEWSCRVVGTGA